MFGASSELASIMEFGFKQPIFQETNDWSGTPHPQGKLAYSMWINAWMAGKTTM